LHEAARNSKIFMPLVAHTHLQPSRNIRNKNTFLDFGGKKEKDREIKALHKCKQIWLNWQKLAFIL